MVADPVEHSWLLTGSSRGQLDVWDLRFRLCVQSWHHPLRQPVEALALALAPRTALGLARIATSPTAPLVYIAAGGDELGLWDLEHGRCHQVQPSLRPFLPNLPIHHLRQTSPLPVKTWVEGGCISSLYHILIDKGTDGK
jgi:hypothetical protein